MNEPILKKQLGKQKPTYYNYIVMTMRMTKPKGCAVIQHDRMKIITLAAGWEDQVKANIALAWIRHSTPTIFGFPPPNSIKTTRTTVNGKLTYAIFAKWKL